MPLLEQIGNDRLPGHAGGTGVEITNQHEGLGRPGDGIGVLGIGADLAAVPITHQIPLGLAQKGWGANEVGIEHQHRTGNAPAGVLELEPGLTDGGGIGPVAEDRRVLTVEGPLAGQLINPLQQRRPGERRFTAGMLGAGFIDRLGHGCLVLIELLEGQLEVGVGVGGAGHEASSGDKPQDVIPLSKPQLKQSTGH